VISVVNTPVGRVKVEVEMEFEKINVNQGIVEE